MKNQNVPKNNFLKIKKVSVILFFSIIAIAGLSSCGGDDVVAAATGCGNNAWLQTIETATNKYTDAATNYSNNPTSDNCKKYKNAGLDYLKAYKKITKCIPGTSKKLYEQAFEEAENEIKKLNCN